MPGTAEHQEAAKLAVVKVVKPAIKRLTSFLATDILKRCSTSVSLSTWPRGPALYRLLVQLSTTMPIPPEEIHQTGLGEIARIRKEMQAAMRQTGFSGDLPDFIRSVQSDKRFYCASEEELLAAYRLAAERSSASVSRLFPALEILPPTMVARRFGLSGPGGSYNNKGTILVNVSNPELRPKFEMIPLMLHEGVPGHHLQRFVEAAKSRRPNASSVQRLRKSNAFSEGWGLYAESLGYEVGLYADPYDRFGQLTYELVRAVRMVVDTGIHSRGWSREQAVRYFREVTGKPVTVAEGEIDRAIWDPASLIAYKAGELMFKTMRRNAEAALGHNFDVRDFHEIVLQAGPLPLDELLHFEFRRWLQMKVRAGASAKGA